MNIPTALIDAFPPSADLLLERARRQTDDAMLEEIARADYGHLADEMMAELRPIRDSGVFPDPIPWHLGEVLALTRFSNPEMPNGPPFAPGPTGRHGHQSRLFACAVLLRAAAEPRYEGIDLSQDSTLAQCLVSAKVLGEEMSEAAACFLTWKLPRTESCSNSLLFALGLLILATRLRSGRIAESVVGEMAECVLAQDSLARAEFPHDAANPMPLPFSVQGGFWQPLAVELVNETQAIRDDDLRINLELCSLLVGSDSSG